MCAVLVFVVSWWTVTFVMQVGHVMHVLHLCLQLSPIYGLEVVSLFAVYLFFLEN